MDTRRLKAQKYFVNGPAMLGRLAYIYKFWVDTRLCQFQIFGPLQAGNWYRAIGPLGKIPNNQNKKAAIIFIPRLKLLNSKF